MDAFVDIQETKPEYMQYWEDGDELVYNAKGGGKVVTNKGIKYLITPTSRLYLGTSEEEKKDLEEYTNYILQECGKGAVKNITSAAAFMYTATGALVAAGSVIGAPVTGGTSLIYGATVAGGISAAMASGTRALTGKDCESQNKKYVDYATAGVKAVQKAAGKARQASNVLNFF